MPKSRNKRKSAAQNERIKQEKFESKAKYFHKNVRRPTLHIDSGVKVKGNLKDFDVITEEDVKKHLENEQV
jgi:hypothetical protein